MNPFSVSSPPRNGGIALPSRTPKDDSTDSYELGRQEEEAGFCNKRFLFRLVGLMVTVGLLGIGLKIVPIEEMLHKKHLKESAIESVITDSKFQQADNLNDATTNLPNNDPISTTKVMINQDTEALDESSKTSMKKSSKSDSSSSSKSDSSSSSKSDSSSSKDSSKESKNNNKGSSTSSSDPTSTSTTSTSTTPTSTNTPFVNNNVVGIMPAYKDPSNSVEVRIQDLLSRMTLEEKTMQMVTLYGYKRVLEDRLPTSEWHQAIWKDGIANIDEHLNGLPELGKGKHRDYNVKVEELNNLVWPPSAHAQAFNDIQTWFMTQTRLGIPVDFSNEGIRGLAHYKSTNFPVQLGLGATWDTELIHRVGQVTGREARALGYTNVYSPVVDLARDPRWGRVMDCYGEDPYHVGELATAMAIGIQSQNVASTAKHWAVYSVPKGGRDGHARTDPHVARRELEALHLFPWKKLIREAKIKGTMSSYNDYDGIPISSSSEFMIDILRTRFGFTGYIVSDSQAIEYLVTKHRVARNYSEGARMFLEAGGNVRTEFEDPDGFVYPVRTMAEEGSLDVKVIDERVSDVLRVKFELGLFDALPVENPVDSDTIVHNEAHEEVAKEAAQKSLVLLKNEHNTLPLSRNLKKILVCGPGAMEVKSSMGRYGSFGGSVESVLGGIKQLVSSGTTVVYEKGADYADEGWPETEIMPSDPTSKETKVLRAAGEAAKGCDAVVIVLGESDEMVGESKSRTSLELPGHQNALVKQILSSVSTKTPVVVVLLNGRPLSINLVQDKVPAILEAWFPGEYGGTAVAEALFGDINPGGKLPLTFPRSVGQIEFGFPQKPGSQAGMGTGDDPNGVGYCLVTGDLYPFGHGLSYTTFEYMNPTLSTTHIAPGESITVTVEIMNTGKRYGDEVVQLYLRDLFASTVQYDKLLKGFSRVSLNPGESTIVTFTLTEEDMACLGSNAYSVEHGYSPITGPVWTVEPGDFDVELASSSVDIRHTLRFTVTEPA